MTTNLLLLTVLAAVPADSQREVSVDRPSYYSNLRYVRRVRPVLASNFVGERMTISDHPREFGGDECCALERGDCGCDACMRHHSHHWMHAPSNMHPHVPYEVHPKTYYYFRPYNYIHIPRHQTEASLWEAPTGMPYSNRIFRKVYRDFENGQIEEVPVSRQHNVVEGYAF